MVGVADWAARAVEADAAVAVVVADLVAVAVVVAMAVVGRAAVVWAAAAAAAEERAVAVALEVSAVGSIRKSMGRASWRRTTFCRSEPAFLGSRWSGRRRT